MGKIVLLDELSINKIAAGEVIERPASVIKEMVENSIDAGATNITVEIKNGGITYIRVTDNGRGISEDDLEMAFERHATSKIRNASELTEVKSMGFRGEALASIGAIANVELISKTADQDNGYRIVVEGGYVLEKQTAGCPNGTNITVRNLFYNTPVRYKFLKKDYTESGYIEDVITRIAQSYPEIAIRLINSGKTVIQTNGNGDLKTVIYSIYGKDIAEKIINVNYEYEDIKITGIVGQPEIARSNRSQQLFFINRRYVKDRILQSATEQALKGMIPIGKFPFLSLNIDMNPNKVDVNVHPAKLEVRFEEEDKIFKAVYHAIKDTMLKGNSENIAIYNNNSTQAAEKEKTNEEQETQKHSISDTMKMKNPLLSILPAFGKRMEKKTNTAMEIDEETQNGNIIEEVYRMHQRELMGQFDNNINSQSNTQKEDNEKEQQEIGKKEDSIKEQDNITVEEANIEKTEETKQQKEEDSGYKQEIPEVDIDELKQKIEDLTLGTENKSKIKELKQDEENKQQIENLESEEEKKSKIELLEQKYEIEDSEQNEESKYKIEEPEQDEEPTYKIEQADGTERIQETAARYNFEEMYMKTFGKKPTTEISKVENVSVFENIPELEKPIYKIIGIVFNTYIILEMNEEMYVIDQHAAHERVIYEKVKKNYYTNNQSGTQMMLLPDIITLTHKEMEIARENMPIFERAGFILEEFGENTIKLSGVPDICLELETKEMFLEALDEITSLGRTAKQEIEE
ncbi:MAG: DNA mismatch repair endonuclease MutL, partial [Clostridia bacterium]|nr:DNA mismatch repair endonuclease MutL [Clostridia bacterium]